VFAVEFLVNNAWNIFWVPFSMRKSDRASGLRWLSELGVRRSTGIYHIVERRGSSLKKERPKTGPGISDTADASRDIAKGAMVVAVKAVVNDLSESSCPR